MTFVRAGFVFILIVFLAGAVEAGPERRILEPALELTLPQKLSSPTDVRLQDRTTVLLSRYWDGVARLELSDAGTLSNTRELSPSLGRNWSHLAVSDSHVVSGFVAHEIWWLPRDPEAEGAFQSFPFAHSGDLDLHDRQLLLAGLSRDESGTLGGDGAMAWLVDLAAESPRTRPVLPLPDGAFQALHGCAHGLVPKARFLPDGSFVVFPAVAPDVYLYDPSGRLVRTWDAAAAGVDTECALSDEQRSRFGYDVPLRQGWLNQRRIVDDLLPLPGGPGLLVRSRNDGVTRWEVVQLRRDGGVEPWPLTVTSESAGAYARGDVLEDRLALLVVTPAPPHVSVPPPRLLIFDLGGSGDASDAPAPPREKTPRPDTTPPPPAGSETTPRR